jgi:MOSC domain-containing protein YiiM
VLLAGAAAGEVGLDPGVDPGGVRRGAGLPGRAVERLHEGRGYVPFVSPQQSVVAVHRDARHRFSKQQVPEIGCSRELGVEGDAHAGVLVQHRSRVRRDPDQPNLRQVHLIHAELLDDLAGHGHDVAPGDLGENLTTRGVDLLGLPTGTLLHLGADAVVRVEGLRNPCVQIEAYDAGLLRHVAGRAPDGSVVRRAGVMGVVVKGGVVRPGDPIAVAIPEGPHRPLSPV